MVKELNLQNFKKETDNGVCVIDFWATWCGPCRSMSPIIDELSEERSDIKFFKVNVDEQEQLAASFGITSIPMFAVMRDGKAVASTVGAMPKERLLRDLGL